MTGGSAVERYSGLTDGGAVQRAHRRRVWRIRRQVTRHRWVGPLWVWSTGFDRATGYCLGVFAYEVTP